MTPVRLRPRASFLPLAFGFFALLLLTMTAHATTAPPLIEQSFNDMYNLEFAKAHQLLREWEQKHPQDPMGPASNAAAYLYAEFDRLGVLESQLFVNDKAFEDRSKLAPDPAVKQKFDAQLAKSSSLADQALAKNANDTNALFAKVLAIGLQSDYAALIQKRDLAALRYTKQARVYAERLLKEKPDDYDAYLAIGIENYLAGLKPAPVRWLLELGGVQADETQGLHDLQLAANHGDLMAPFAKLMLAVAALRNKNTAKACSLLGGLATSFPKNPLYRSELSKHCH